jgi:hypothetical protein
LVPSSTQPTSERARSSRPRLARGSEEGPRGWDPWAGVHPPHSRARAGVIRAGASHRSRRAALCRGCLAHQASAALCFLTAFLGAAGTRQSARVCERRMRSCAAALTPVHPPELIIAAIDFLLLSSFPLHISPPLPAPCAAQCCEATSGMSHAPASSRCPWRLTDLGVRC